MGAEVLVPLLALLGVVVTAAVSWFIARRAKSGKIETTEAKDLWVEANSMRHELRDQVKALQDEILALKTEGKSCRDEVTKLRAENDEWRQRVDKHEATITDLRDQAEKLRKRVMELETAR